MIKHSVQAKMLAARYLQPQGLKLIEQNCRGRRGEFDLIIYDGASLVFFELRMRRNSNFGGTAASIDIPKQQHIIHTAHQYLAGLTHTPPCRFDAILMDDVNGKNLQWLKNAFEA
jgi:putative endonuclease